MTLEGLFCRLARLRRFRLFPLGPEIEGFCEWLCNQGFSREAVRNHLWQASHFNQYLRRLGVRDYRGVEKSLAERFIKEHLPRCRCRSIPTSRHVGATRSVRSMMDYLSERGLLAPPIKRPSLHEELLEEYLGYLKCERDLAERTIGSHRRHLISFLDHLGPKGTAKRLCKLSPDEVQTFFTNYTQDLGRTTRRHVQGTLRGFFRFCVKQGYIDRDLTQAVPQIRTYKLSHLPRSISDQDAQKVLESIDRTTAVGRRDYAIIQLLYRYGVRGCQVRALRLQDIQWRLSRIRFPALKGGKEVVEPLTEDVGDALLEYLRRGRPHADYAEVFLTTCAPFHPLRSPSNVSFVVAKRMREAGVSGCPKGSHAFRHGFAVRMLKGGQSLKAIADMLGHRHINTTFIYTKVDLETLKQLPLEWPEVYP